MNKFTISAVAAAVCLVFSVNAMALNMSKDEYKAAGKKISAQYKADKANCDTLAGNAKDICKDEAKGKNQVAEAELEAQYKPSNKATYEVSMVKAKAAYAVAKEKCDDKDGNDEDVCVKEAKAALVRGKADAKAQLKTAEANATAREETADARVKANENGSEARRDATVAKRDADYKVQIEKCDKFAGDTKDQCVARAKTQFGK
ncbi:MAG: hypothetical protein PHI11_03990 [Gallionella sp.]|nr:hypothetical protein [Gallionella sp.]